MMSMPPTKAPAHREVAQRIVEFIRNENLEPGNKLPTEQGLSTLFSVSRRVVREAVQLLATTGLIRVRQGSGLYVSDQPLTFSEATVDFAVEVEPENVNALFTFRRLLEVETVGWAATHIRVRDLEVLEGLLQKYREAVERRNVQACQVADCEFHQFIADITKNPFIMSSLATTLRMLSWTTGTALSYTDEQWHGAVLEHEAIVLSIRAGDAQAAGQVIQRHLETSLQSYHRAVQRTLLEKP